MLAIIITAVVTLVVAVPVSLAIANSSYKKASAKKVGSAEDTRCYSGHKVLKKF